MIRKNNNKDKSPFSKGNPTDVEKYLTRQKHIASFILMIMFICVSMVALTGCSGSKKEVGNKTEKTDAETFRVVTSFYPIYIMAWNLLDGIDGVEIANMAKPSTGCLHDYQLRPRDLVCLDGADVFLTNGAGMEDFLADVLEAYPDLSVYEAVDALDMSACIEEEGHHHEDHEHEEGLEHKDHEDIDIEDEDHDHEEGLDHDHQEEEEEINPHTWLDPVLYRQELAYFKDVLVENDPTHKEAYEMNYQRYDAELAQLQEEYSWDESESNSASGASALILHESFPYILRTCHISLAGAADVEKDSGFSAKELRELVDEAKECQAGYIFSDNQYSGRVSGLLAEETGMEVIQLDSCVSGEYDKNAYINRMKENYHEIIKAKKEVE